MTSLIIIITMAVALILYGLWEYRAHQKAIYSIPIRIHINGTRGKSSVTRLIGAGLRAGGVRAITKVTGTFPRLILEDGAETAIYRKDKANILEQLSIVKFASGRNVDALVIECMALQPKFQKITEHQMVHATIGVITNVRLDHLDVMGPHLQDVAKALSGTIPKNQHLFTSESRSYEFLEKVAQKKKTIAHRSLAHSVSNEEMAGFSYIEHKDNVALALDVCKHLGIDRTAALEEMKKMNPDEGALLRHTVSIEGKRVNFYNAFAANDPESSLMIWNSILDTVGEDEMKIVLLTTRQDRMDRARQLIEMISAHMKADLVIFIGESGQQVKALALKNRMKEEQFIVPEWDTPESVYSGIGKIAKPKTTIVGIGNMGAMGAEVARFFELQNNH